jgi:hypothetical protein
MFIIITLYGNRPLKSLLSDLKIPHSSNLPEEVLEAILPAFRLPLPLPLPPPCCSEKSDDFSLSPAKLLEFASQGVNMLVLPDNNVLGPDAFVRCLNLFDTKVGWFGFIIFVL